MFEFFSTLPIRSLSRRVWHKAYNFFLSSINLGKLKNSAAIFFYPFFLTWLITGNLCLRTISNVHLILRISLLNRSNQRVFPNWCQSLKRHSTGACCFSTGQCSVYGIELKVKRRPLVANGPPEADSLSRNVETPTG